MAGRVRGTGCAPPGWTSSSEPSAPRTTGSPVPRDASWAATQVALRPGLLDGRARVDLSWERPPSAFADGYVLERWLGDELDASCELTDPDTSEFTDRELPADTGYTYRLRAVAGDWASEEIGTTTTTPACEPAG